ncbi:MAG: hypothetical protein ABI580_05655 [Burkholderiaceae bacterium]
MVSPLGDITQTVSSKGLSELTAQLAGVVMSLPATITCPLVGVLMHPIRFNIVDLPLPDGPAIARNTPAAMPQVDVRQGLDFVSAKRILLRDMFESDDFHQGMGCRGIVWILMISN